MIFLSYHKNYMSIRLLDCTLRDGGYINDWNFTKECFDDISLQMQRSGCDFVELGIMGNHNDNHFKTKFRTFEEIPIPQRINNNTKFTVMMTGTEYNKISISKHQDGDVDAIRFAFFKADWREAILQMKQLIDNGYIVFSQTMATYQYSQDELVELIREINRIRPFAFYIVDSFGTFYPYDIDELFHLVDAYLDQNIAFGFHAHNNLQLANANCIQFMQMNTNRPLIVDGSIYGMGRGAGNANIEILMHYLNGKGASYNDELVWKVFHKHIKSLRAEYSWGYLPEQYLVSKYHTNPAYIWYLSNKGVRDFEEIKKILSKIPEEKRYTLNKDVVDYILSREE